MKQLKVLELSSKNLKINKMKTLLLITKKYRQIRAKRHFQSIRKDTITSQRKIQKKELKINLNTLKREHLSKTTLQPDFKRSMQRSLHHIDL